MADKKSLMFPKKFLSAKNCEFCKIPPWIQIEVNGCVFAGEKVGSVAGKEIFSEGTRWHYQSQLRPSPLLEQVSEMCFV